jgi:Uma2 family endonuclease
MLLDRVLPDAWHTRTQSSITTADSEPLPDVAVVAGTPRDYLSRHPASPDIALVVEVSDASLDRDRREKAPLYARAGITAYWIVNLQESVIEIHTDPTGPDPQPRYRSTTRLTIADAIPVLIPGQPPASIPVKDMLP